MERQELEGKYNEISGAIKQKFGSLNLSEEELKNTHGDINEIVALVAQKLGIPKEEAQAKVQQALSGLNIDESAAQSFSQKISKSFDEFKSKFKH